jgi:uncharacterized membrane protein YcjF (UPF0283 family)
MNRKPFQQRSGFVWRELFLGLAILAFILQLFPMTVSWVYSIFDIRNWSSWAWFLFFCVVCIGLCLMEYGSEFFADIRRRHTESVSITPKTAADVKKERKNRAEERERAKQIREARQRRIW